MNSELLISLALFVFVVYRISSRAYVAYTAGAQVWPVLALLAVIYAVVAAMRMFGGMHSAIFFIVSFACIILSRVIYRSGRAN